MIEFLQLPNPTSTLAVRRIGPLRVEQQPQSRLGSVDPALWTKRLCASHHHRLVEESGIGPLLPNRLRRLMGVLLTGLIDR